METTSLFKISLLADSNMKKAKKLANAGYSSTDGVGIYRSMSFNTAQQVEEYLTSLKVGYSSVKLLQPVVKPV